MKFPFFILILTSVFFNTISLCQVTNTEDSLLKIYKNPKANYSLQKKVLSELYYLYLYSDQEKAEHYLYQAYEKAIEQKDSGSIASFWGAKGVLNDIYGVKDSSRYYYQKAIAYYNRNDSIVRLTSTSFNLAMIEQSEGNLDKAIQLVQTNLIPLEQVDNKNRIAQAISYGLLSRVYLNKGFFQLALENGLTAVKLLEQSDDKLRLADALGDLAMVESDMQNRKEAIDYQQKANKIYKEYEDYYYLADGLANLGTTYHADRQFNLAKKSLNESLEVNTDMTNQDAANVALIGLGQVYYSQQKYVDALIYLEQALAIIELTPSSNLSILYEHLGKTYAATNNQAKALEFLNKAINTSERIATLPSLRDAYFSRSRYYENQGNFEFALQDYKSFHALNDSIFNTKKINAIEEMRVIHDTEQKENEILLLEKNAELDKLKRNRLRVILIGVLAFMILLFWAQWQRRKKAKEIATQKRKVVELENQRLKTELEFKRQELASKVLQLCRKSEFLQSLNNDVSDLKVNAEGFDKQQLEQLSRKIDQDMNTEAFWEEFLKSFEEVHPNFKRSLNQRHPEFAPNEIRLAHLMRMNLDTKDIASLLNITAEGVKKARYRMRKKMGEDSSVNLTEYFINFENVFERNYA